jgi:hypothetical protein
MIQNEVAGQNGIIKQLTDPAENIVFGNLKRFKEMKYAYTGLG